MGANHLLRCHYSRSSDFPKFIFQAKWIGENLLQVKNCVPVNITFTPSPTGNCFKDLSVNVTWRDGAQLPSFVNARNSIAGRHSDPGNCHTDRFQTIYLNGRILLVDQLTGNVSQISSFKEITIGKPISYLLPEVDIQIFHNMVLTNFSDFQLKFFESTRVFHLVKTLEKDAYQNTEKADRSEISIPNPVGFSLPNLYNAFDVVFKIWVSLYVGCGTIYYLSNVGWPAAIEWGLRRLGRERHGSSPRAVEEVPDDHSDGTTPSSIRRKGRRTRRGRAKLSRPRMSRMRVGSD